MPKVKSTFKEEREIILENQWLKLFINPSTGTWGLATKDGRWLIRSSEVSVETAEKTHTCKEMTPSVSIDEFKDNLGYGKKITAVFSNNTLYILYNLKFYAEKPLLTIESNITLSKGAVNKVLLLKSTIPYATFMGETYAIADNYHSWALPKRFKVCEGCSGDSPWNIALSNIRVNDGMVVGFITSRKWGTTVKLEWPKDHEPVLTAECNVEDGKVTSIQTETLAVVYCRDWLSAMKMYAKLLALNHPPRYKFNPPSGWCSWYEYYLNISEEEILKNIDLAARLFGKVDGAFFQIDDGWEQTIGEWEPNEKFPHGMKWLADRIKEKGLKPGLWLAPFIVSHESTIYKNHPDWLVKDSKTNEPKVAFTGWGNLKIYALDLTHPEVLNWLHKLFKKIVEDWGYEYIKIDFLYYSTIPGKRFNEETTVVEAYRNALKVIREAVGDKVYILGCGAPLNYSIEYVDGMRIGADIFTEWSWIALCTRYVARRFHLHKTIWHNDPDCIVVREPLTLDQARAWASIVALSGGVTMHSDILYKLKEERLNILEKIFPPTGVHAEPLDLFKSDTPQVWRLKIGDEEYVIGVFNWSDEPDIVVLDFEKLGFNDRRYIAFDFWEQKLLGVYRKKMIVKLPPTSCKIIAFKPLLHRPQVISVDTHITQGFLDLKNTSWNGYTMELRGTLRNIGRKKATILVYVPGNYSLKEASSGVEVREGFLELKLELTRPEVEWYLRFDLNEIDLMELAEEAIWENNDGTLKWGNAFWAEGINRITIVKNEEGGEEKCLYLHPKGVEGGFIRGWFKVVLPPHRKAVFEAKVGFKHGMEKSDGIKFSILAKEGKAVEKLYETYKKYDGRLVDIKLDLSKYSGKSFELGLMVDSAGTPHYDHVVCISPKIKII
ncbi:MAG: alpha-galactosidase [Thermoproteales archaeon]|nr:alpha-galactosidase [Thermoproteales archaeon]